MESAYGVGEPPPELSLSWSCTRWNCLPESGGYLAQDYYTMHRMTAYSNIYNVLQKWQHLEGRNVHSLSDNERRILRWLKDLGIMFQ